MCPPATAGAVAAFVPAKRGRPVAAEPERLATPPAPLTTRPEPLAPSRAGRFVSTTALETDRVLRRLAAVGSVLVLPLARAAAALVEHTAWQACGFRTQADFTRERLGRDSRWLRQLVSLHRAQERLPALAQALCGADGGSPLGQVAALLVGRVATPENVQVWIDRARQLSLEELRVAVRLASSEPSSLSLDRGELDTTVLSARAEGVPATDVESAPGCDRGSEVGEQENESRVGLRFSVPPDVRWIFEAGLELYRCVEGLGCRRLQFRARSRGRGDERRLCPAR